MHKKERAIVLKLKIQIRHQFFSLLLQKKTVNSENSVIGEFMNQDFKNDPQRNSSELVLAWKHGLCLA